MILAIVLWAATQVVNGHAFEGNKCIAKDSHGNLFDTGYLCIRKISVTGNNEAASAVRRKVMDGDCFNLVSKDADGTLAVEQHESSGGINGLASMLGAGSTTRDGTVLWQDSKQGMAGISSTGAKNGAIRVLESLYKVSGCDKKGRRQ